MSKATHVAGSQDIEFAVIVTDNFRATQKQNRGELMKNLNLAVFLLFVAAVTSIVSTASADDELYYSAAMCTPSWQHGFDGSGEEGFLWNLAGAYWQNNDSDNEEWLICPVPFDRSQSGPFEVRVVIRDGHDGRSFVAQVTRQTSTGTPAVAAATGTSSLFVGKTTLFLTVHPESGDRWINLYLTAPQTQGNSKSRVYGYRVCRTCD
jgi:hypothetical protein